MMSTSDGCTGAGRRDRKKRATRQALRTAALRLVAERGFDHVTVEEIAEAADVATRTFFNHFSSKEDAVVGMDPERLEHLRGALAGWPEGDPALVVLRSVLGELAEELTEQAGEWRLRARVLRENPALLARQLTAYAGFERLLAEAVARRTGTAVGKDIYPSLTAAAAVAALRAAVTVWLAGVDRRPLVALFADAFDRLAGGLPAPGAPCRPPRAERVG